MSTDPTVPDLSLAGTRLESPYVLAVLTEVSRSPARRMLG